jgi:hypothetical protein
MKRLALALLASAAWASAAYGQTTPTVTRSYTYEWIHVRISLREPDQEPFQGLLLTEDVSGTQGAQTRFLGYLHGTPIEGGDQQPVFHNIFDCTGPANGANSPNDGRVPRNANIVQVGPFAQQATGDITPILGDLDIMCTLPPDSLTINCPFQGVQAPQAPDYVTFTHSGTFRTPANLGSLSGSYSQNGRNGLASCVVVVNGVTYVADGTMTNMMETRRGPVGAVAPDPRWQEPTRWFLMEDLVQDLVR